MKISIECTAAEKIAFKRNLKINSDDTGIIYTQQILDKPADMTSGEYFLSAVEWRITDWERVS